MKSFQQVVSVLLFGLLGILQLPTKAQSWRWAQSAGGTGYDLATCLATDSAGNQYVGGFFADTATFGATTLTSAGGHDGFIAKLDSTGAWLWVQQLGGVGREEINRLRLDERRGALLVLGTGAGGATLGAVILPAGPADFIARLDPVTGTAQWAQRADAVRDAAVQATGTIVVCGAFKGDSLRLDAFSVANTSADTVNESDMYVAALSPAGVWQWLEGAGGQGDQWGEHLAVDEAGAIYVGGPYKADNLVFPDSVRFGSHVLPIVTSIETNYFLAKLSSARTWDWAYAALTNDRSELEGIAVDRRGAVYIAASTNDHVIYYGNSYDTIVHYSFPGGNGIAYVACLTPQGQPRWVAQTAGNESSSSNLVLTPDGNVVLSGRALDMLRVGNYQFSQFSPLGTAGNYYSFVAALDSAGRWLWADTVPDLGYPVPISFSHRHLTTAGYFSSASVTFGAFTLTNPLCATSQAAVAQRGLPAFIHRFGPATGPAGTIVMLSGTGFAGTTAVFFGTIPATSFTMLPNGQLQVTVPPGVPTTGPGVLIQVVGPNGSSLSLTRFGGSAVGLAAARTTPAFYLLPNPAHERAGLIGLPAEAASVQLLDGLGRVVRTQPTTTATLDLRGLAPGVYVVRAGAAARRLVVE